MGNLKFFLIDYRLMLYIGYMKRTWTVGVNPGEGHRDSQSTGHFCEDNEGVGIAELGEGSRDSL